MEVFKRSFSDNLPIGDTYSSQKNLYDAQIKIWHTITLEIRELMEEKLTHEEAIMLENFCKKIELAQGIFCAGGFDVTLERGALELIRIQALLVSMFMPNVFIERFDELSQLAIKGSINPTDKEIVLNKTDERIFTQLGRFGFSNDQFNEQVLSVDYLPVLELSSPIGDIKTLDILSWAIS
jgi:hypothetical protein